MLNMKYVGIEEIHKINFKRISENVVEISGNFPVKEVGFTLSRVGKDDNWDYSYYTKIYRETENGVQFSNDGSIYIEKEKTSFEDTQIPYENYEETLEEIKNRKISEMNAEQQSVIQNGVEVTLSDGTTERFTLKDQDQMSLMGLQTLAEQGIERIPWHEADNLEHCKYYSSENIKNIASVALSFISYHVTYFRDLRIYINSMSEKEDVQSAYYGMYIPTEYQSEVLADFYSAQNA